MTEDEKKLIQARHRLEAVQARNRQKERKARTRRLIQEGAILESVWPEIHRRGLHFRRYICYNLSWLEFVTKCSIKY